jgi:hypothetical protein
VLQLLKEKQLYAKPYKCSFGVKEVEYLGHIVSHEGVNVDPNKINSMMDWPIPKTLKNQYNGIYLFPYIDDLVPTFPCNYIKASFSLVLSKFPHPTCPSLSMSYGRLHYLTFLGNTFFL